MVVNVIPLESVMPIKDKTELFRILRDNVKHLKGSLLLNALFEYEWKD